MGYSRNNAPDIAFDERFYTDRLMLRLPLPGDGKAVYEATQESLPELKAWMPWANRQQTEEDNERLIIESHNRFIERSDLRYHAYLRSTGELVLCGGLHGIDWDARKFEIGYWLRSRFAGMGYASEAAWGLERLAAGQLGANRIEIRVDRRNVRSIRIAERLGYTLEGMLRQDAWNSTHTAMRDTMLFAKVRGVEL